MAKFDAYRRGQNNEIRVVKNFNFERVGAEEDHDATLVGFAVLGEKFTPNILPEISVSAFVPAGFTGTKAVVGSSKIWTALNLS